MTIFNISILDEKKHFDNLFLSKPPSSAGDIVPEIELRFNSFGFDKQSREKFKKTAISY